MTKVYLEITVGEETHFQQQEVAYGLWQQYYEQVGPQYGLDRPLEELDDESKEMLKESFASDPTWTAKGNIQQQKPAYLATGRIVVELYTNEAPKAAENFRCLCTGEKGKGKSSGKPLHYKGAKFHRIVTGFMCQGGDVVRGDGSGGDSIYGGKFNDEKPALKLKHDGPGIVGMANSGKNSNTSQFYMTLAAAPQCDGKHVVIGRVTEGIELLQAIGKEASSPDGKPRVDVKIMDCGMV